MPSCSRQAGGLFYSVKGLASNLSRHGIDTFVICGKDEFSEEDILTWPAHIRPILTKKYRPYSFSFMPNLVSEIERVDPDIIHVHGWLAGLLPLYLKTLYKDEPLFSESKIVTSIYETGFEGTLNKKMLNKIEFDGIDPKASAHLKNPDYHALSLTAIEHSDALIKGSKVLPKSIDDACEKSGKPLLSYHPIDDFVDAYIDFYQTKVLK